MVHARGGAILAVREELLAAEMDTLLLTVASNYQLFGRVCRAQRFRQRRQRRRCVGILGIELIDGFHYCKEQAREERGQLRRRRLKLPHLWLLQLSETPRM